MLGSSLPKSRQQPCYVPVTAANLRTACWSQHGALKTMAVYCRLAGTSQKVHEDARLDAGLVAVTVTLRISALFSTPSGAVQVAAALKVGSSPSDSCPAAAGEKPVEVGQWITQRLF